MALHEENFQENMPAESLDIMVGFWLPAGGRHNSQDNRCTVWVMARS